MSAHYSYGFTLLRLLFCKPRNLPLRIFLRKPGHFRYSLDIRQLCTIIKKETPHFNFRKSARNPQQQFSAHRAHLQIALPTHKTNCPPPSLRHQLQAYISPRLRTRIFCDHTILSHISSFLFSPDCSH